MARRLAFGLLLLATACSSGSSISDGGVQCDPVSTLCQVWSVQLCQAMNPAGKCTSQWTTLQVTPSSSVQTFACDSCDFEQASTTCYQEALDTAARAGATWTTTDTTVTPYEITTQVGYDGGAIGVPPPGFYDGGGDWFHCNFSEAIDADCLAWEPSASFLDGGFWADGGWCSGQKVSSCPQANLVGCCASGLDQAFVQETCYYAPLDPCQLIQSCNDQQGYWTTTPL